MFNAPGSKAYVVGFGVHDTANLFNMIDSLQMDMIEVISLQTCNAPDRYNGDLTNKVVCAGMLTGRPQGAAAGDSGGPLYRDINGIKTQIGIVSHGDGPYSTSQFPGIYTNVAYFRDWIDSVINANTPTSVGQISEQNSTRFQANASEVTINFKTANKQDVYFVIYDNLGQTVVKNVVPKGSKKYAVNVAGLSSGIYFLKLTDEAGSYFKFAR